MNYSVTTIAQGEDVAQLAIPKRDLSRDEWLNARRTGIGSSDAAAVVGQNPYKTPYQLWLEKRGEIAEPDLSDNEAVQLGNSLEAWVGAEFARRTGRKVRRDNFVRRHPEHPHMLANLDFRIVAEDGGEPEILECKIAGAHAVFGEQWGDGPDEVPRHYLIQVMHQMIVDGRKRAFIAALLASTKFRVYEIAYDAEIAEMLIAAEARFWRSVQTGELPEIMTIDDALRAYPISNGAEIQASSRIALACHDYRVAKHEQKQLDARIKDLQGKIGAFMGDAEILMRGQQKLLTWKTQTRAAYAVKESSTRVFRLAKEEEAV